ncbi:hypothetical protein [Effusibacillus lacus]|uniref:Uncharacterized protein n=1 Tax=Effusibacillus lacus TaxID=1348429 RepID=A0A292YIY9_9BACL|nr:hypothetical protein [Effusibacillus lacus]TCS69788.1 hypothetical protein EDD64_13520 [Effusibacillus lacus]GAX88871.1 hypothetical protein EFBL_0485 [Effusibacillus lacus]
MMKRIFNMSSPLGIALTVAGVVLALSPEARKATRQVLVKGTSLLLGAADTVKNAATGLAAGGTHSTGTMSNMLNESRDTMAHLMEGSAVDSGVSESRPQIH